MNESNGTWGTAIEVPGIAQLSADGTANLTSVSCGSAGNCAAVGNYGGTSQDDAFVANEVNGVWNTAIQMPGTATLGSTGAATVDSVSCSAATSCAAGGLYPDGSGHFEAWVADMSGSWKNAIPVPGLAALNAGGVAELLSITCPHPGTCSAGGYYSDAAGHLQAFVVDEKGGVWQNAASVPHGTVLNAGGDAQVSSISCSSATNCAAGGFYTDGAHRTQAFVVRKVNGAWGKAVAVPGIAHLNVNGYAVVNSISCAGTVTCVVGGQYAGQKGNNGFVANEQKGVWSKPTTIAGEIQTVSCSAAGTCAAGGGSPFGANQVEAIVMSEKKSLWGAPTVVPGSAALNVVGDAEVWTISCAKAGRCGIGGYYADWKEPNANGNEDVQAFVTSP